MNLRIPGPIPVPGDVLEAMSGQMINHRGPQFEELLYRVSDGIRSVFETDNDVYVLTASGTGAMEAAVVNTLSPGDKVLNLSIGFFGDRFGEIARIYGAEVTELAFPWGRAVDVDDVRQALNDAPDIQTVLVTHNETSTGVANDVEAIAGVAKGEFDKLLLVDGISSVCSVPLKTDAWGCDVVATASQKGWMLPPGLAFISISPQAWEAYERSTMPKYYLDVGQYRKYYEKGQPPYTPGLSTFFALDKALGKIAEEGLGTLFERHKTIAQMTRDGVKGLGLELFPEESVASDTVTAVNVPKGVSAAGLLAALREEHGIVLGGGQGPVEGKILRIGHMGRVEPSEIQDVIDALGAVLPTLTPGG